MSNFKLSGFLVFETFQNLFICLFDQQLYEQSLHIKSAIPHPLIMGVIRGKCISTTFVLYHSSQWSDIDD